MARRLSSSGKKAIHILTTSSEMAQIPIIDGFILLCVDNGKVYYDYNNSRKQIAAEGGESSSGSLSDNAVTEVSCSNNIITVIKSDGSKSNYAITDNDTTYSVMVAATASDAGKSGLVPMPTAGTQDKFLRGDGTWQTPENTTYTVMKAATDSAAGSSGLVPAPEAGKITSFLRGDGTWSTPAGTIYDTMIGATASTSGNSGLVPAPVAGDNVKFLCGDGTWQTIDTSDTTYDVFTGTDGSAAGTSGLVPAPNSWDKDCVLYANGSWNVIPTMTGATSTDDGTKGFVPSPSASEYNSFLRGDGTWATPDDTTYSTMAGATSDTAGTAGLVPAPEAGKEESFLKGDGTWAVPNDTTYSDYTGATTDTAGTAGLVPAPEAGKEESFLKGDGTWSVPNDTTYSNYTGATATEAGTSGLVPAPEAGKQSGFLKGDGTWSTELLTKAGGTIDGTLTVDGNLICRVSNDEPCFNLYTGEEGKEDSSVTIAAYSLTIKGYSDFYLSTPYFEFSKTGNIVLNVTSKGITAGSMTGTQSTSAWMLRGHLVEDLFCVNLGNTADPTRIYGSSVYLGSSSTAVTSDKRMKKDFTELDDRYETFFMNLKPQLYRYINGQSGRLHTGFIAQEVEEALETSNIDTQDFAGYISDGIDTDMLTEQGFDTSSEEWSDNKQLYLRYEEFIALNTYMIQKLKTELEELKQKQTESDTLIQQLQEQLNYTT